MYFAAIDLGGTYVKSCRIDIDDFRLRDIVRVPFPSFEPDFSSDARTVKFARIMEAVKSAVAQIGLGPECAGLFLSNQMHGFVLMNGSKPLSDFSSWQDSRSTAVLPEMLAKLAGFDVQNETGEFLRAGFPVTQLYRMSKEGLASGEVCDLGTAALRAITGEGRLAVSPSNAAASGAFDLHKGVWHSAMLEALSLGSLRWPEIADPLKPLVIWKGVPVFAAIGDQQASLLGADLRAGAANFNIATGSQASAFTSSIASGNFQVRPFFGNYIKTVTHIPAGRSLNSLMSLFIEMDSAFNLERAWSEIGGKIDADLAKIPALKVDLSFYESAFSKSGALTELREGEMNVVSIMRGAFRSIADRHVEALQSLGLPLSSYEVFTGSGGVLRKSAYLRAAFRRNLGRDLALPQEAEDALNGHARRARAFAEGSNFVVNG